MYYPCSENKGDDQLRVYREADLRLCFHIGKNPVFLRCGSYVTGSLSVAGFVCLFVVLRLKTEPTLPGFNQLCGESMCLAQGPCGNRFQDLSIRSPMFYHFATALPVAGFSRNTVWLG